MKIRISLILFVLAPMVAAAQSDSVRLVWPSPPDQARIKHVQTISSLESFHSKKGFFAKLLGFFAGSETTPRWLVQPVGIAVSPVDGRILIADPGANCIHMINPVEKEYDFIAETKYGKFISPVGLALAPDGTLFVSDSERGDIIVFDHNLDAESQIKGPFTRPTGLQVISDKLYVVDAGQHKIVILDLHGKYLSSFGQRGTDAGEFNFPLQIAARESIYVVDGLNYRVQKFDLNGRFASTLGQHGNIAGRFASPKGIALDSDGDVYVTDALMDNFQIFSPTGHLLLIVGHNGTRDGEFMSPGGITIDRTDKIYVAETLNKRVQVFQYVK